MQHLTLETLARLLDEPGTPDEAAHLEVCAMCRAEFDGLRRQSEALHRLGPMEPPPTAWDELERRLVREALVTPLPGGASFRARSPWTGRLLRIAAALALYAAGAGTMLALRQPAPARVASTAAPTTTATAPANGSIAAPVATTSPAAGSETAPTTGESAAAAPRLAAAPEAVAVGGPESLATPEEAMAAVHAAEQSYLKAYARYAELTGGQQAEDPVTRVAALESIGLTTREALDRAPADPVINGYHLTAVAQRDAALRQIALRSDGPWF